MKNTDARIILVGAGPGDPELLTIKGLKAIQEAKVIVYDALIDRRILGEAPDAEHIYVGKRKGYKAMEQDHINALLVEKAISNGSVVRLKGGDAFVFGRGWEELEYAVNKGVAVSVVPGLSSSLSVPALAGIPVTHRHLSTGFHVITGTLANGSYNQEIDEAAKSNATLVVLMGLSKVKNIVAAYRKAGKPDVAIAIVSNGSRSNQSKLVGRIGTIERLVTKFVPESPAIIVVGKVVELASQLQILNYGHEAIQVN